MPRNFEKEKRVLSNAMQCNAVPCRSLPRSCKRAMDRQDLRREKGAGGRRTASYSRAIPMIRQFIARGWSPGEVFHELKYIWCVPRCVPSMYSTNSNDSSTSRFTVAGLTPTIILYHPSAFILFGAVMTVRPLRLCPKRSLHIRLSKHHYCLVLQYEYSRTSTIDNIFSSAKDSQWY